jgi:hypothetical protein
MTTKAASEKFVMAESAVCWSCLELNKSSTTACTLPIFVPEQIEVW